jgi:hypothetical protein
MREFKIGQYVFYRSRAEGRFVVMRLLPQPKGEPRYVIRSEDDASVEHNAEAKEQKWLRCLYGLVAAQLQTSSCVAPASGRDI